MTLKDENTNNHTDTITKEPTEARDVPPRSEHRDSAKIREDAETGGGGRADNDTEELEDSTLGNANPSSERGINEAEPSDKS